MALPPLTMSSFVTEWTFDPIGALLIVATASAYAAGVRRLAQRGRAWSRGRSASMAVALVTLTVATQSGLAAYDTELFSAHVVQHLLLGVVGPFFLALSAPVTLALQAFHRPTQVNLLRALHSRPIRAVSHPVVVFSLFAFSLFVLYFTPLYELSLRNDVVHAWVHLHFVVVGSLFFWVAIGLDPAAHRISYGTRLLIVALTVPFHAFLGVALMNTAQSLAPGFDAAQGRIDQPAIIEDQHAGGALMWTFGDLVGLAAGGVIALQWFHHEERRTRRLDRRLDAIDDARATQEEHDAHEGRRVRDAESVTVEGADKRVT